MTTTREESMLYAYTMIRRQVLEEVIEEMFAKYDAIMKLLENGRPLLKQAPGYRYESILNQRQKLYIKLEHISQAIEIVNEMR